MTVDLSHMKRYEHIDQQNMVDILKRFPVQTTYMDFTLPTTRRSSKINIPRLLFIMPNGDELNLNVEYATTEGRITLNANINNSEVFVNYPVLKEFVDSVKFNFEFGTAMVDALRLVEERMYQVRLLVKSNLNEYKTKNIK